MRENCTGVCLLLATLIGASASAAVVEVQLVDELGAPFFGIGLELVDLEAAINAPPRVATSDPAGQAVFADVPAGRYRIDPVVPTEPTFVRPEDNPLAPAPEVTVAGDDEVIPVSMELWRGASLAFRVESDGAGFTGRVVAYEPGYRIEATRSLGGGERRGLRVIPGRWEIRYEPPPGFVVTAFAVDGQPVEGLTARVDAAALDTPVEAMWTVLSPAEVTGVVVWRGEPSPGVSIEAELIEPGPWIEQARRSGQPLPERLGASVVDDRWTMMLPDGRWRLRPVGDAVVSADPAHLDLELEPGDYRRADFVLETDGAAGEPLIVTLRGPGGVPLPAVDGAVVEAWPLDPAIRGDAPAARVESDADRVTLRSLPPGDYLIAAAHPRHIEGYAVVRGFGTPREDPVQVPVSLRPGAILDVVATDADGQRVPGVAIRLTREPAGEQPVIDDPRLSSAASEMEAITDATGRARAVALWPGRWAVDAGWAGGDERPRFAVVEGEAGGSTVRELADGDRVEVAVRLEEAAALQVSLVCDGRETLPATASAAVVTAGPEMRELDTDTLLEGAVLRLDDLPLRGRLRDRLTVGPLPQDAYQLAVRPTGFDRWSWLPGTEEPAAASEVTAFPGSPTDVGIMTFDCAPRAELFYVSSTDEPVPDLTIARENGAVSIEWSVDGETTDGALAGQTYRDRVVVADLPGRARWLRVRIDHPYLLPAGYSDVIVAIEPAVGQVEAFDVEVEGVGGAIRLQGVRGVVARVTGELDGRREIWTQPIAERGAFFPALPRGRYEVVTCDDAECARPRDTWRRIPVDPASTTVVP